MKPSLKQLLDILKPTSKADDSSAIDKTIQKQRYYTAQSPSQRTGERGELIACTYLEQQGLQRIDSNIASSMGEIDLLMQDGECLVFVEVKLRKTASFGGALASITPHKLKRLRRAIELYLQQNPQYQLRPCRIDAVAIQGTQAQTLSIEWIKNIDSD